MESSRRIDQGCKDFSNMGVFDVLKKVGFSAKTSIDTSAFNLVIARSLPPIFIFQTVRVPPVLDSDGYNSKGKASPIKQLPLFPLLRLRTCQERKPLISSPLCFLLILCTSKELLEITIVVCRPHGNLANLQSGGFIPSE